MYVEVLDKKIFQDHKNQEDLITIDDKNYKLHRFS